MHPLMVDGFLGVLQNARLHSETPGAQVFIDGFWVASTPSRTWSEQPNTVSGCKGAPYLRAPGVLSKSIWEAYGGSDQFVACCGARGTETQTLVSRPLPGVYRSRARGLGASRNSGGGMVRNGSEAQGGPGGMEALAKVLPGYGASGRTDPGQAAARWLQGVEH